MAKISNRAWTGKIVFWDCLPSIKASHLPKHQGESPPDLSGETRPIFGELITEMNFITRASLPDLRSGVTRHKHLRFRIDSP